MNKEQFLTRLQKLLSPIPNEEANEILRDFEEHFSIGKAEGKSEADIVAALGAPEKIAKEMIATYRVEQVESDVTTGNVMRAVWAVIGLGFFNLVIVLGPFLGVVGLVFGGWVMGVSFTLSPLLLLLSVVMSPGTFEWFDFFSAIMLCGMGLIIGIAMYYATKYIIIGFMKYLHFNIRIAKGGYHS